MPKEILYQHPAGELITVLPTCSIPLSYLVPDNWKIKTAMGNFRAVYSVDSLSNGIKPKIVVHHITGLKQGDAVQH